MKAHLLTGDSLLEAFKPLGIEGQTIISRECLIAGNVTGQTLTDFWQTRSTYVHDAYGVSPESYNRQTVQEFEKLLNLPPHTELYLWFEYDLFCQVNMWFSIWLIRNKECKAIYRIAPVTRTAQDRWKGFGGINLEDLRTCYYSSTTLSQEDIRLGAALWEAFQKGDLNSLQKLSKTPSACFPYLQEVCTAHVERVQSLRPQKVLQQIVDSGVKDFHQIFNLFSLSEGIYGYGDLQVKEMYTNLLE